MLSHSQLNKYEQCPLSYKLHYIDKIRYAPGPALTFGSAIHKVLEELVAEHITGNQTGILSQDSAAKLWQEARTDNSVVGLDVYKEGLEIIENFVKHQGAMDYKQVLSTEKKFIIKIGPYDVLGFIDRIDKVDDKTIKVIDYKTNRNLYNRVEVDNSLQLAIYCMAAKEMYPWAKNIQASYWMLRQSIEQQTEFTDEQLDATRQYIVSLGNGISLDAEFKPRLNEYCCYCDHRAQCPAYAEALTRNQAIVCDHLKDPEKIAQEREALANISKIVNGRKAELEKVLKEKLKSEDELVLGGVQYRMFNQCKYAYPVEKTLDTIEKVSSIPKDDLLKITKVDNTKLNDLLKKLEKELGRPRVRLLKTELEASAKTTHSPRLWAKKVA